MKTVRERVFETNSSSTHSLVYSKGNEDGYVPKSDKIIVNFIDTNDECCLCTLREKVSYLVSHIISKYMYDCEDYDDLKEQVERSYDFIRIADFVRENFKKEVVLPKTYSGDLEYIVSINHQLICSNLDDLLDDLTRYDRDYLEDVLSQDKIIEIGHD